MIAKKRATKWIALGNYEILRKNAERLISEIMGKAQPKLGQDLNHLNKLADLKTKFDDACTKMSEVKKNQDENWDKDRESLEQNWQGVILAMKSFSIGKS